MVDVLTALIKTILYIRNHEVRMHCTQIIYMYVFLDKMYLNMCQIQNRGDSRHNPISFFQYQKITLLLPFLKNVLIFRSIDII